jgi:hypothetical protein
MAPRPVKRKLSPGRVHPVDPDPGTAVATRRKVSAPLVAAWQRAQNVTDQDVASFIPTSDTILVGEAFLAGNVTVQSVADYVHCHTKEVNEVLSDPVAMAWISRQIHSHLAHRMALVDASLFQRAIAGEVAAIKLFYERHHKLTAISQVNHNYNGTVKLDAVSDDDLKRLIKDADSRLPGPPRPLASRPIIDVPFTVAPGAGDPVPCAPGAGAASEGGPVRLLSGHAGEPPETAGVPGSHQDAP